MEVVGLISAVVGLADPIANRLTQLQHRFSLLRNAPPSVEELRARFHDLHLLFTNIATRLSRPDTAVAPNALSDFRLALSNLPPKLRELEELVGRMEHTFPDPTVRPAHRRAMLSARAFFRANAIAESISRAERLVDQLYDPARQTNMFIVMSRSGPAAAPDEFHAYFDDQPLLQDIVLNFSASPPRRTPEAQLKHRILQISSAEVDTESNAVVVTGMGGLGKTTTATHLIHDAQVRAAFPGGIHCLHFGKNASAETLRGKLEVAVRMSGGMRVSEDVKTATTVEEAARHAACWVSGKRVLFVCDDIWPPSTASGVSVSHLARLWSSEGNAGLITTRDKNIGVGVGPILMLSAQEDFLGERSRAIFLKHASAPPDIFSSEDEHDHRGIVEDILTACAGVPLTLAVAGKSVSLSFTSLTPSASWTDALTGFHSRLQENEGLIAVQDLNESNAPFTSTVSASLICADDLMLQYCDRVAAEGVRISPAFTRLCILQKGGFVAEAVFRNIWKDLTRAQVVHALSIFLRLHLIILGKGSNGDFVYGLHDLLLDFTAREAEVTGIFKTVHREFLSSYLAGNAIPNLQGQAQKVNLSYFSRVNYEQLTRRWWSVNYSVATEFVLKNIGRLLVSAELLPELIGLLSNARWLILRESIGGVPLLQQELDILICSLLTSEVFLAGEEALLTSLKILRSTIGLLGANAVLPNNLASIASCMLLGFEETQCIPIQRFIETSIDVTPKPCFIAKNRFWKEVFGSTKFSYPMPNSCCGLGVNFEEKLIQAVVCREKEVSSVQCTTHAVLISAVPFPQQQYSLLSMSPSGKLLALVRNRQIFFWDCIGNEIQWETNTFLDIHELAEIESIKDFSRKDWACGDRFFAFGGVTGCLFHFDTIDCVETHLPRHHTCEISAVDLSPLGNALLSGDIHGCVICLDTTNMLRLWDTAIMDKINLLGFGADESEAFFCNLTHIFRRNEDETMTLSTAQEGDVGVDGFESFSYCSASSEIITTTVNGRMQWRYAESGTVKSSTPIPSFSSLCVVACPTGKQVVFTGEDGVIRWLDKDMALAVPEAPRIHSSRVTSVALSLDRSRVISTSLSCEVKLWSSQDKSSANTLDCEALTASFTADGSQCIIGETNGSISWWDSNSGEKLKHVETHHGPVVRHVALSADGSTLVSLGYTDGMVHWFDLQSDSLLGSYATSSCGITSNEMVGSKIAIDVSGNRCSIVAGHKLLFLEMDRGSGEAHLVKCATRQSGLSALCMKSDGSVVLTGDKKGILQTCAWGEENPTRAPCDVTNGIVDICADPNMTRVIVAKSNNHVSLWVQVVEKTEATVDGAFPPLKKKTFAYTSSTPSCTTSFNPVECGEDGEELLLVGDDEGDVQVLSIVNE